MKKLSKITEFLEWNYDILLSSMKKVSWEIILFIALDALFYMLSFSMFYFWNKNITQRMNSVILPPPESLASLGIAKIGMIKTEAQSFFILLSLSILLLIAAIIFLASIIKGIIWSGTSGKRPTIFFISKFFLLNLIWMGLWFALIFSISFLAVPPYSVFFMLIAIMLGVYFTNILYSLFVEEWHLISILRAIKLGACKIHLFAIPYAIIFGLFYLIALLGGFFKFKYHVFVFSVFLIAYCAVQRYYAYNLVKKISQR